MMARKSQHTFSKREREQKKAKKAAEKRARRNAPSSPAPLPEAAEGDSVEKQDQVQAAPSE